MYNKMRERAQKFFENKSIIIKIDFLKNDFFLADNKVNIYRVTLSRNGREDYQFNCGVSLHKTTQNIEPNEYDIILAIQVFTNMPSNFEYQRKMIDALDQNTHISNFFTEKELNNISKL